MEKHKLKFKVYIILVHNTLVCVEYVLSIVYKQTFRKEVRMTRNQIEYWKVQYDKEQRARELRETQRANLERERLNRAQLAETQRVNTANMLNAQSQLQINRQLADETHRSNLAREAETFRNNNLTYQNNLRSINETSRTHRINEAVAQYTAATSRMQYVNDLQRVGISRAQVANALEIARMNVAEQRRNNNLVNNVQLLNYGVNRQNANNQERMNIHNIRLREQEQGLTQQSLVEQKRHNEVTEYIGGLQSIGNFLRIGGKIK